MRVRANNSNTCWSRNRAEQSKRRLGELRSSSHALFNAIGSLAHYRVQSCRPWGMPIRFPRDTLPPPVSQDVGVVGEVLPAAVGCSRHPKSVAGALASDVPNA